MLLLNVGNSAIFSTLASVCIIAIYLAYLLVTAPMLYRRLTGGWISGAAAPTRGPALFSLGRWGVSSSTPVPSSTDWSWS